MSSINEIGGWTVDAGFRVPVAAGPGSWESVCEAPLEGGGLRFERTVRADLTGDGRIRVEVRSAVAIHPVHRTPLPLCLKLMGRSPGLPIRFGADRIRDGVFRVANPLKDD
jgi:hypothetical protein